MNDMVTIKCYGKEHAMTRLKAIKFYKECMECSEGSERDRYVTIFLQLLDGETYCSDEE